MLYDTNPLSLFSFFLSSLLFLFLNTYFTFSFAYIPNGKNTTVYFGSSLRAEPPVNIFSVNMERLFVSYKIAESGNEWWLMITPFTWRWFRFNVRHTYEEQQQQPRIPSDMNLCLFSLFIVLYVSPWTLRKLFFVLLLLFISFYKNVVKFSFCSWYFDTFLLRGLVKLRIAWKLFANRLKIICESHKHSVRIVREFASRKDSLLSLRIAT